MLAPLLTLCLFAATPDEGVAQKTLDPTASQFSLPIEYKYGVKQQSLTLKPQVPYEAFGQDNVLRITLPFVLASHAGSAFVDTVEMVNLAVFAHDWGRWGLGPVVFFAEQERNYRPQAGPAGGFTWKTGNLSLGLFTQTLFGTGVSQTIFQPIIGYTFNPWLTLSNGNPKEVFDWRKGEFTSVPIGLELGVIVKPAEQHLRFTLKPEVDVAKSKDNPTWTTTVSVELLMPSPTKK